MLKISLCGNCIWSTKSALKKLNSACKHDRMEERDEGKRCAIGIKFQGMLRGCCEALPVAGGQKKFFFNASRQHVDIEISKPKPMPSTLIYGAVLGHGWVLSFHFDWTKPFPE
jgi:hypothetical protein